MARVEDIAPARVGRWLDAPDRSAMDGIPFVIQAIDYEPSATFGPRYVVEGAVSSTGEVILIPFGATTLKDGQTVVNEGRKAIFTKLMEAIDAGTEIDPVLLIRADGGGPQGTWILASAEGDALANPAEPVWAEPKAERPEPTVKVGAERLSSRRK